MSILAKLLGRETNDPLYTPVNEKNSMVLHKTEDIDREDALVEVRSLDEYEIISEQVMFDEFEQEEYERFELDPSLELLHITSHNIYFDEEMCLQFNIATWPEDGFFNKRIDVVNGICDNHDEAYYKKIYAIEEMLGTSPSPSGVRTILENVEDLIEPEELLEAEQ